MKLEVIVKKALPSKNPRVTRAASKAALKAQASNAIVPLEVRIRINRFSASLARNYA